MGLEILQIIDLFITLMILAVSAWYMSILLMGFVAWPPPISMGRGTERDIAAIIKKYTAQKKAPKILDLGSGFGGVVLHLANAMPKAHITGIEILRWPMFVARLKKRLFGYQNLTLKKADFFKENIKQYDVVTSFLYGSTVEKLRPQLEGMRKGSLIIAYYFPLNFMTPVETVIQHDLWAKRVIYIYQI